jgi:hypothetical protein
MLIIARVQEENSNTIAVKQYNLCPCVTVLDVIKTIQNDFSLASVDILYVLSHNLDLFQVKNRLLSDVFGGATAEFKVIYARPADRTESTRSY